MNAKQTGFIVGIVVSIILLVFVALRAMNRDGALRTKYDERQLRARGTAYKYGMFAAMITCGLLIGLDLDNFRISALGTATYFLPILVGVIVQVSYSIFADAYVGMNTSMPRYIIIMTLISALNLFYGGMAMARGEMITDGRLSGAFINLCTGIMFIVVAIELIIKKLIDSREERDAA